MTNLKLRLAQKFEKLRHDDSSEVLLSSCSSRRTLYQSQTERVRCVGLTEREVIAGILTYLLSWKFAGSGLVDIT